MENSSQHDFANWLRRLNSGESLELSVWQEALQQLRQLHGDIWNGVMFFFAVNGVLIAAIFTLAGSAEWNLLRAGLVLSLVVIGLIVTVVGLQVFKGHRRFYVQMLLLKTLIEKELGFYDVELSPGQDLAFPWKVDKQFVPVLVSNAQAWLDEHRFRRGTNSWWLLCVYGLLIAFYVAALVIAGYATLVLLVLSAIQQ